MHVSNLCTHVIMTGCSVSQQESPTFLQKSPTFLQKGLTSLQKDVNSLQQTHGMTGFYILSTTQFVYILKSPRSFLELSLGVQVSKP